MSYAPAELYHDILEIFEEAQHLARPYATARADGLTSLTDESPIGLERPPSKVRAEIQDALLRGAAKANTEIAKELGRSKMAVARARKALGLPPSKCRSRAGAWRWSQRVRERIAAVLAAPGGAERTNASIAAELGHDEMCVSRVRAALGLPLSGWMRRRDEARALLLARPDLGNIPIAKATGAAPATVRELRRRLGIPPIAQGRPRKVPAP